MLYYKRLLGLLTLFSFLSTAQCQLDEMAFTSDAQCHGTGTFVNATCPMSSSVALNNIRVGTRPTARGCLGNETNGDGTGCCQSASDANETDPCEFDFPITDNVLFHEQCNGRQSCQPDVQIINVTIEGSCNTSVYPDFAQYMYFNYFCIEDSRVGGMDSSLLTFENETIYLQSPDYLTMNISSSVSQLSCSVQTDNCNAAILIHVIELNLADVLNSTQCNQTQTLSIIEEDESTLINWTCNDNTFTTSQPLQTVGTYILVNFTNTMTKDGGRFWIGFQVSLPANLTLECPAVNKQHCFPTTMSSSTSSPASTATSSTPSSSTSTKTRSSTTPTTRRSFTTPRTSSTSRSLSTQRPVTVTPGPTQGPTPGPDNTLITATAVSGGVFFVVLIIVVVFGYKKVRPPGPKPEENRFVENVRKTLVLDPPAVENRKSFEPSKSSEVSVKTIPTEATAMIDISSFKPNSPRTLTQGEEKLVECNLFVENVREILVIDPPAVIVLTYKSSEFSVRTISTEEAAIIDISSLEHNSPRTLLQGGTKSPPEVVKPKTRIIRISSNMCRRYYRDLLKTLAEDAFLFMIYNDEKNGRKKKRRIKRNSVNPKRK